MHRPTCLCSPKGDWSLDPVAEAQSLQGEFFIFGLVLTLVSDRNEPILLILKG